MAKNEVIPLNIYDRLTHVEEQLKSGGGSGTSDGMEVRVARLEAHMEHVVKQVDRLADIPTDLAVLKVKVNELPTKGWLVTGLLLSLGAIAALIAFAEKIQALVS